MEQQLYAKIKRSSKYYSQGDGAPFEVLIVPGDPCGYVVMGGPGGQYRLSDVNLFVIENGQRLKIA